MLERGPQPAMIVILKRHKPERLQHSVVQASHRTQDFRHAVNRSRLRLKGYFDKVALPERLGQAEEPAGGGYGLQFRFCAAAVFESNRSQDGIS